jgi:hypothetical protein
MRKAVFIVLCCALLAAAGCTPMYWTKPGASDAEVGEALADCRRLARREARFNSFLYGGLYGSWHLGYGGPLYDPWGRSMYFWPYYAYRSPFYDPFYGRLQEEQRLERFCMRSRGFELRRAEQPAASPQ